MSEAIMARRVNKVEAPATRHSLLSSYYMQVTTGGRREKFSVLIAVGDGQGTD